MSEFTDLVATAVANAQNKGALEQSRDEIRSRLRREKVDGKIQQFVAGLMARAKVNHEAAQSAAHP